jgi:hypothetical protein
MFLVSVLVTGEARREILKGGTKNLPRSVCETYAYATSRTISAEDTAVVLETFANVSYANVSNILLLFQVESKTDLGLKRHSCAFVSVLEEYAGPRQPGESLIRALFRSPCATRNPTLVAQSVTRRRVLVTAIDGGTSTVLA